MGFWEEYTDQIVHVIKDSQEYKKFEQAKQRLAEYPDKWNAANEYRKQVFLAQIEMSREELYTEMERLELKYSEVRKDILVDDFLTHELVLCKLMQKMAVSVVQSIDLELDF